MLERMGYSCDIASNGQDVLLAMGHQRYDLILMDVQMPIMDGIEATERIHQLWGKDDCPVIFAMTANVLETDRNLCLESGMDGFIAKPIHANELVRAVEFCTAAKRRPMD